MSPEFGLKSHILWSVCVFFIVLLLDLEFQYSENISLSSHIFEKLVFPTGFLSFNGTLKMLQNSFHQNSWEIRLLKMAAKSQLCELWCIKFDFLRLLNDENFLNLSNFAFFTWIVWNWLEWQNSTFHMKQARHSVKNIFKQILWSYLLELMSL